MSYSTPAMLRKALVPTSDGTQPSSPTGTAADLTDDQLMDAIAEADATIDSYIGGRYTVPVAPVIAGEDEDGTPVGAIPHPVDYFSRNLAAYNATLAYRGSLDFADTDPVARRYTATLAALTGISQGKIMLQVPNNTTGNAGSGAGQPINPYIGSMFEPRDFSLYPLNPNWPMRPDGSWNW